MFNYHPSKYPLTAIMIQIASVNLLFSFLTSPHFLRIVVLYLGFSLFWFVELFYPICSCFFISFVITWKVCTISSLISVLFYCNYNASPAFHSIFEVIVNVNFDGRQCTCLCTHLHLLKCRIEELSVYHSKERK